MISASCRTASVSNLVSSSNLDEAKNERERLDEPLSFFCFYVNGLEELDAQGHHKHILSGMVDVAEIEGLTEGGVIQALKHVANTEVVVDIEGETLQQVAAEAGLKAPSNALRIEILVGGDVVDIILLPVKGIGLVEHGL